MKETLKAILFLLVIAALLVGLVSCERYRIDLYKRKYPGTTTWDYFMDVSNHK